MQIQAYYSLVVTVVMYLQTAVTMKLVVIGMPKARPRVYVAICSAPQLGAREWW